MKHLIVYSHPNPGSFNKAILDTTVDVLQGKGHGVTVRDLYAIGFNPVLKGTDFELFQKGGVPDDIRTEQEYITAADTIILIYPIWWAGSPAMMKGYIDRVFSHGFAYKYDGGAAVGLLGGKKGLIVNTHGASNEYYDSTGMTQSMKMTSDTGIFGFTGVEVADHLFFGAVPSVSDSARREMLDRLKKRVSELFQ